MNDDEIKYAKDFYSLSDSEVREKETLDRLDKSTAIALYRVRKLSHKLLMKICEILRVNRFTEKLNTFLEKWLR